MSYTVPWRPTSLVPVRTPFRCHLQRVDRENATADGEVTHYDTLTREFSRKHAAMLIRGPGLSGGRFRVGSDPACLDTPATPEAGRALCRPHGSSARRNRARRHCHQ